MPATARSDSTMRLSSANTRSGETDASAAPRPARAAASVGVVGDEAEFACDAYQAQDAQRVGLERERRDHAQRPRPQVGTPSKGSIGAPPASGSAIALTVRSRSARSSSIVAPRSGSTSTCHCCRARSRARRRTPRRAGRPRRGRSRARSRAPPARRRRRARCRGRTLGDRAARRGRRRRRARPPPGERAAARLEDGRRAHGQLAVMRAGHRAVSAHVIS